MVTDTKPLVVDDEFGVLTLLTRLWAARWMIVAITGMSAVVSVYYALSLPNMFRATTSLSPVADTTGGLGRIARGGLSSIAGLVGIDVGTARNEKTGLAVEILQSRKFINSFVERRGIVVPLVAGHRYEPESGRFFVDTSRYDPATKRWSVANRDGTVGRPSEWVIYQSFSDVLEVKTDVRTGITTVSVEFLSPRLAAQWANWLVDDLNNHMRTLDAKSAQASIRFLEQQVSKTPVIGLRQVFFELIEEQTKNLMLTQVQKDYVFSVVDPAMPPELKSRPMRALICMGITLGGFLLALLLALLMDFARSLRRALA